MPSTVWDEITYYLPTAAPGVYLIYVSKKYIQPTLMDDKLNFIAYRCDTYGLWFFTKIYQYDNYLQCIVRNS